MAIPQTDLQSEFSLAYVRAVAHAAGFGVQESGRMLDGEGVDLTIFGPDANGLRWEVRAQVKSWSGTPTGDPFPYDLKVKNYEDLRQFGHQVPAVLVVVAVPPDRATWIRHSEAELVLRRCGYWCSLLGQPATTNQQTVRIQMPRQQVFDIPQLQGLLSRVQAGSEP